MIFLIFFLSAYTLLLNWQMSFLFGIYSKWLWKKYLNINFINNEILVHRFFGVVIYCLCKHYSWKQGWGGKNIFSIFKGMLRKNLLRKIIGYWVFEENTFRSNQLFHCYSIIRTQGALNYENYIEVKSIRTIIWLNLFWGDLFIYFFSCLYTHSLLLIISTKAIH